VGRAIAQLAAEGLIEPVRRRVTVVRASQPGSALPGLGLCSVINPATTSTNPRRAGAPSGPSPCPVACASRHRSLLGLEAGAGVIIRDRVMGDPATG
jgi:GntR family transcriptional regulator